MDEKNEVDKLFEELPSEDKKVVDIFEPEKPADNVAKETPEEEVPTNRTERRLRDRLQKERESNIALNARIQALAEMRGEVPTRSDSDDIDSRWLAIYGDTPATRQAWKLQKEMFQDMTAQAKEDALKEIRQQEFEAEQEQKHYDNLIDSELESIEDTYNVDVTSDAPAARKARREFLEMVQRLSPKDEDGMITGYADFGATWEAYQFKREREKPSASRQKDMADRSMAKSGGNAPLEKQPTPGFFGWKKDYNI